MNALGEVLEELEEARLEAMLTTYLALDAWTIAEGLSASFPLFVFVSTDIPQNELVYDTVHGP